MTSFIRRLSAVVRTWMVVLSKVLVLFLTARVIGAAFGEEFETDEQFRSFVSGIVVIVLAASCFMMSYTLLPADAKHDLHTRLCSSSLVHSVISNGKQIVWMFYLGVVFMCSISASIPMDASPREIAALFAVSVRAAAYGAIPGWFVVVVLSYFVQQYDDAQ